MAIVTTNANTITGSATNTLGTLGRSVFNSTIGTFADKDTMNQVYKTIEKLNASIETVDKKFDYEAFNGRNKIDDVYAVLSSMNIEASWDFMNKSKALRNRLLNLNKKEKDITLNALGVDVTGESNTVTNEYVKTYNDNEADHNDYYEDYVKTIRQNQLIGDETTSMQLESSNHFNYSGLHNDLYSVTQNLYPDDENKGTFANKWIVENRNSLMYKTKKLFNSKKVKTIISRFHTDPNAIPSTLDNAKSKYGLSHGRNLLTKDAEKGYSSSYRSGYDDPYCRVWTHHHQYDRYYKTIRPFSTVNDQGNYVDTISVKDFHKWSQFSDAKDTNSETSGKWGWKKDSNNGWQYSVLQDNGMVNITPKYINGEATNIHTKQCMFSIENLAWRGYDPYSFEQALSWEQRGPLGGRIMWFPPYGIQFNETTTTQWANNTFLGRGEDVYTYTNTTRTGSLSFMMVVDHPSILDYVAWSNDNRHSVTDTDILRFLAGCGEGSGDGGDGLRSLAKPTPLTDEYTQVHDKNAAYEEGKTPTTDPVTPEEEKVIEKQICFYVFYPNNYSGTYDDPNGLGKSVDATSIVEPIPYLLAGNGAQKDNSISKYETRFATFEGDKKITWGGGDENTYGNGYEMGDGGLGKEGGCIFGTEKFPNVASIPRFWSGLGGKGASRNTPYTSNSVKKWLYRIDGRYSWPKSQNPEEYINYYNQKLELGSEYVDNVSKNLNLYIGSVIENLNKHLQENIVDKDGRYYYNDSIEVFTLGEIAYVLNNCTTDGITRNCNVDANSERIKYLKETLEKGTITKVEGLGYASKAGYSSKTNDSGNKNAPNKYLAENRAKTATNWFVKTKNISVTPTCEYKQITTGSEKRYDKLRVNDIEAKSTRCARVIITFKSTEKVKATTADNTNVTENETVNGGNSGNSMEGEIKASIKIVKEQRMVGTTVIEDGEPNKFVITETISMLDSTVTNSNIVCDKKGYKYPIGIGNMHSYNEFIDELKTKGITIVSFKEGDFTVKEPKVGDEISVKSVVTYNKKSDEELKKEKENLSNNRGGKVYLGYSPTSDTYTDKDGTVCKVYVDENGRKWYLKDGNFISVGYASEETSPPIARYGNGKTDENRLRYDQEYHFFKVLEQTDPVVYGSLMDKLQYFDPAFHSMTPEGFNGRLTFLQQCMRQGNTVSASDGKFAKNANNLAFGRAPYCVLRLGDFYNQMIVIDNLSINYDPLVWDLNVEGVGVQPLIAHITISFKFVGGGDMTGPVRRLQNAMSFNYYANARLYDNRADRIERKWSDKTNGAIEHDEILKSDDMWYQKGFIEYDKELKQDVGGVIGKKSVYAKGKNKDDVSQFYTTQMYQ